MSRTFEEVRDEAMALSPEEWGHLAEELLDSVRSDEDVESDEAYASEIQRRVAEIEAGTAKLIPGEDVIRELRAKYGERAPEVEGAWLDEVERRTAFQDAGAITDIEAEDLYREMRRR
jgi:putative addiction module component (TIGR02574 family)